MYANRTLHHTLGQQTLARLAAAMWLGCGALVLLASVAPDTVEHPGRAAVVGVGAIAMGLVVWFLPWYRWPDRATLVLLPVACAAIALFNASAENPWLYGTFFVVAFVWVGLAQPPGTALASTPVLVVAYLVPLRGADAGAVPSMAFVVPVCVLLGEAAAFVAARLRDAERRHAEAEQRFAALIDQAAEFVLVLSEDGEIRYASPAVGRALGWSTEELVGRVTGSLVHPDDVSATFEWFEAARTGTGDPGSFEYRAAHRDGSWRWVEGTLSDLRDDPAVGGIVWNGRDVTERRHAADALVELATRDGLTGLLSRTGLLAELDRALDGGGEIGVVAIDLDGFKVVNDTLGHLVGDDVLRAIATTIAATVGERHVVGRLGGDEFLVVVSGPDHAAEARRAADALRDAVGEPFHLGLRRFVVSASLGLAVGAEREQLLRHADLALYEAKGQGRNRVVDFDAALADRARRRLDVETELRTAIEQGELFLELQPEVDLRSDELVGVEALVRWHHPTRGVLAPGEFIDIAEDAGLVVPLGAFVLDGACRLASTWSARHGDFTVACNVSPLQLQDDSFVTLVAETLARHGTPPATIRLELTESALLTARSAGVLSELRDLGVRLAIDDFGTGYSSLSYLDRLPVDALKIDRSFLAHIVTGEERAPLIEAIAGIARALDLHVVAEGVETPAQRKLVSDLGCQSGQGFLFGRPLGREQIDVLLQSRRPRLVAVPPRQLGTSA
jgi:diguanylate cyclase (GGDEF)-like protein/PAS domain S-box-containing protein